ncbi:MAG: hypothetical protein ACTSRS_00575 [Candidatus Helarchaeota archaeon]
MVLYWDTEADAITEGDKLREVLPTREQSNVAGMTIYVFTKIIFHNPRYIIPKDPFTLFYNFLNGGSREYPSDGTIPVDVVAEEITKIFQAIRKIENDPFHPFHKSAKNLLANGEVELLRGTMKLYIGNYTTRDWRRKRSTDDIDFWISDNSLLEYVLSQDHGWQKNKITKEWEKKITWNNIWTGRLESAILIASNDMVQGMDFGSGSYLEGCSLKDVLKKKIVRGHDVDLSDIINVAIVGNIPENYEPDSPWMAFEEAANMRHRRVNSNLISLSRYAHGIADYLYHVGESIRLYKGLVKDQSKIPNPEILKICRVSSHWLSRQVPQEPAATRYRIYNNLVKMERKKIQYSETLREFANRIFNLLNKKYEAAGIFFKIQE